MLGVWLVCSDVIACIFQHSPSNNIPIRNNSNNNNDKRNNKVKNKKSNLTYHVPIWAMLKGKTFARRGKPLRHDKVQN